MLPALALGVTKGIDAVMKQPPRNTDEPILNRKRWISVFVYSFVIMACTMGSVDVEKSTNVNETSTQNNFTLYSNPFTNDCKIKGTEANGTIIIYNE